MRCVRRVRCAKVLLGRNAYPQSQSINPLNGETLAAHDGNTAGVARRPGGAAQLHLAHAPRSEVFQRHSRRVRQVVYVLGKRVASKARHQRAPENEDTRYRKGRKQQYLYRQVAGQHRIAQSAHQQRRYSEEEQVEPAGRKQLNSQQEQSEQKPKPPIQGEIPLSAQRTTPFR